MKAAFVSNGYESLALEYLSASLKRNGVETELFLDPCLFAEDGFWRSSTLEKIFSQKKILLAGIKASKPDAVLFSVFTDTYKWALELAAAVKAETGAKTVFGGIHPTTLPLETLSDPAVDYVCLGEGDDVIPEILSSIKNGSEKPVKGAVFKSGGRVIGEAIPAPLPDVNSLPLPDKELFYAKYGFYSRAYLVSASRGCPYDCSYCCNNVYRALYRGEQTLRLRKPGNVIAELMAAKLKYKPAFVHFTDEVLNADKKWLMELLKLYGLEIGLPFSCYLYPDLTDGEIVAGLKKAGCVKAQLGVQRFDEARRLTTLKRSSSNEKIADAIGLLKSGGIFTVCDNIAGLPDETGEEFSALLEFYRKNRPDLNDVFFLRYYPGSELTKKAAASGVISGEDLKKINAGEIKGGLIKPSRGRETAKRAQALLLAPALPAFMAGLAKKLPLMNNIFLRILIRILKRPEHDFHTGQFVRRHLYFIREILRGKINIL